MKINPCLIFLLLLSHAVFPQSENDRKIYYDSLWIETEAEDYTYYRIIKDYKLTKSEYQIADYYKSGKVQMTGNFADREGVIRNGEFVWYYENGNKKSSSNYKVSKSGNSYHPSGDALRWYENGNKKLEAEYIVTETSEKTQWRFSVKNSWDKDGVQQVKDGNGTYIEDDGKSFIETGQVKNGRREGAWKGIGIGKNKLFTFLDEYKSGEFVSGVLIDSANVQHSYDKIVVQPKPKKGLEHFYKFVAKKFKFPRNMDNANGRIVISFIINKNGDATDLKVVKSMDEDFDNEAIRVIKAYPDWEPGKYRGMDSRTQYTIPITIKSE